MSKSMQFGRICGARMSVLDGTVLLFGALATWLLKSIVPEIVLLPIVLGHFFLFCNVFRIGTRLELIWSIIFAANVIFWTATAQLSWLCILAVQTPFTVGIISLALVNKRYHGLGCTIVNRRNIQSWLDGDIE